mgnify:CR=1 FL=1
MLFRRLPRLGLTGHGRRHASTFAAVDWGTTSFRAWLVDSASGAVVASVNDPSGGILSTKSSSDFPAALRDRIGAWSDAGDPLEVYCCGMITSQLGWVEVPYQAAPAGPADIVNACMTIRGAAAKDAGFKAVHFVPGLSSGSAPPSAQALADGTELVSAPDVMRGEETQILGLAPAVSDALASGGSRGGGHLPASSATLVLPGTHSKWAQVNTSGGEPVIEAFRTFMTGEVFSVLKDHSILGKLMATTDSVNLLDENTAAEAAEAAEAVVAQLHEQVASNSASSSSSSSSSGGLVGGSISPDGFTQGVRRALASCKADSGASLLSDLFTARTVALCDPPGLPNSQLQPYLSGLLIGYEIAGGLAWESSVGFHVGC